MGAIAPGPASSLQHRLSDTHGNAAFWAERWYQAWWCFSSLMQRIAAFLVSNYNFQFLICLAIVLRKSFPLSLSPFKWALNQVCRFCSQTSSVLCGRSLTFICRRYNVLRRRFLSTCDYFHSRIVPGFNVKDHWHPGLLFVPFVALSHVLVPCAMYLLTNYIILVKVHL